MKAKQLDFWKKIKKNLKIGEVGLLDDIAKNLKENEYIVIEDKNYNLIIYSYYNTDIQNNCKIIKYEDIKKVY